MWICPLSLLSAQVNGLARRVPVSVLEWWFPSAVPDTGGGQQMDSWETGMIFIPATSSLRQAGWRSCISWAAFVYAAGDLSTGVAHAFRQEYRPTVHKMALASGHILDIARRTLPTSLEMRPRGLRRAPSSPATFVKKKTKKQKKVGRNERQKKAIWNVQQWKP